MRIVSFHTIDQVAGDCVTKQKTFLWHVADLTTEVRKVELVDRHAVDQDLAFLRIVQPRDEIHERALSAPRRSDDADRRSGRDLEIDVAQDPPWFTRGSCGIMKADIPEFD